MAKGGKVTVKDRDKGAKALQQRLDFAKGRVITIGIHGEEGAHPDGDSGLTVAEVATINEFGEGDVPARPFVSSWAEANESNVKRDFSNLGKAIVKGKITPERGLDLLALKYSDQVKAHARSGIAPPNAPSTIAKKGSDTTLVDTGQMVSSITGKVE